MKLTSLYESNSDLSLEEAVKIFHDECKPFQKEIGFDGTFDFKPLKRGMKNKSNILIGNVRPDRRQTDTPLPIHEFMDNWFYEKFGVKFRSNAMFATKSQSAQKMFPQFVTMREPNSRCSHLFQQPNNLRYRNIWRVINQ